MHHAMPASKTILTYILTILFAFACVAPAQAAGHKRHGGPGAARAQMAQGSHKTAAGRAQKTIAKAQKAPDFSSRRGTQRNGPSFMVDDKQNNRVNFL